MTRHAWIAALLALSAAGISHADLTKVERRIAREPKYSATPRYVLLVFGPEGRDRVWLVKDGDTLYVDRNGDGDLTGAGEKVIAKKGGSSEEEVRNFAAGDLSVGGKKYVNLRVNVMPLKRMMFDEYAKRPDMQAALKADPQASTLALAVEMEAPHLKAKGRVTVIAGPIDLNGPLVPARKPADAPIIHLGGPLSVTFYASRPTMRRNRSTDFVLVVGTPGRGPGTFAMIGYDDTIPATAHPTAEIVFPPEKSGGSPVKKRFEFKERC
jgi:hypothetical protein